MCTTDNSNGQSSYLGTCVYRSAAMTYWTTNMKWNWTKSDFRESTLQSLYSNAWWRQLHDDEDQPIYIQGCQIRPRRVPHSTETIAKEAVYDGQISSLIGTTPPHQSSTTRFVKKKLLVCQPCLLSKRHAAARKASRREWVSEPRVHRSRQWHNFFLIPRRWRPLENLSRLRYILRRPQL